MPDESWTLTDTLHGLEASAYHEDKPLHDEMAHNEAHPWTIGWPFSDTGVLTGAFVIGIPLTDTLRGLETSAYHEDKPLHDEMVTDDNGQNWQSGWEFNERTTCADAIASFDRVVWKLTLGRW